MHYQLLASFALALGKLMIFTRLSLFWNLFILTPLLVESRPQICHTKNFSGYKKNVTCDRCFLVKTWFLANTWFLVKTWFSVKTWFPMKTWFLEKHGFWLKHDLLTSFTLWPLVILYFLFLFFTIVLFLLFLLYHFSPFQLLNFFTS